MTIIVERVFDGLVMLTFILISVNLLGITSPEIQAMTRFGTPLFLLALAVFLCWRRTQICCEVFCMV
jgi:hypothetical protein